MAQLPSVSILYYCNQWEGQGRRRLRSAELMLSRAFPVRAMEALLVIEDAAKGLIEVAQDVKANGSKAAYHGRWIEGMLMHLNDAEKALSWVADDPDPPFSSSGR
ncbi:hypothetical protein CA606_13000 [Caulobacter vibrioides]|uniref:Uncharacterized protein n=2 Tax=Caulobacter vibrioides TaxID=155892 RepID=A0A290MW10_CAUVI|nr:hypothetical protein CA606_13000 [Caulobacter vibrioides]